MIYVDDMRMEATVGRLTARWSHLFSDVSREELDEFAVKLGLDRAWIQLDSRLIHYDVTDSKRNQAIALGAKPIHWSDLPEFMKLKPRQ